MRDLIHEADAAIVEESKWETPEAGQPITTGEWTRGVIVVLVAAAVVVGIGIWFVSSSSRAGARRRPDLRSVAGGIATSGPIQPPVIRPNGRGASWARWLLAAFAGLLAVFAAVLAMQQFLGPSPIGNTVLYARTAAALLIGTVAAGLVSGARTAARWTAAFLLVLVAAVGGWFLYLAYSMLTIGI